MSRSTFSRGRHYKKSSSTQLRGRHDVKFVNDTGFLVRIKGKAGTQRMSVAQLISG